jgi:hypothetical protein
MSILVPDRVLQTTTTVGVGPYALIAAAGSYRPFSAVYANGAQVPYCATDNQTGFEIGVGTLTIGTPDTIARTSLLLSSIVGAVNWTGTTKQIFAWDISGSAYVATFSGTIGPSLQDWGTSFVFVGSGTGTFSLPSLAIVPRGYSIRLKNSGTAVCNVAPHAGEQIESFGASTSYPQQPGSFATYAPDLAGAWRQLDVGGTIAGAGDAQISSAATHDFLTFNGSKWANTAHATATSYLDAMVGDSGSGGTKGLVPAPGAGDAASHKVLHANGTWAVPTTTTVGTPVTSHVVASGSTDTLSTLTAVRTQIYWNSNSGASKSQAIPDPTLFDGYEIDVFDFFGDSASHPITITPGGSGSITVASLGSVSNIILASAYGNLTLRGNAALNTWIVT